MAFPTSSLTNNQVHKEGNRAFVYDSALGVWDQVRETDRTESKIFSGKIASEVTFPAGFPIQVKTYETVRGTLVQNNSGTPTNLKNNITITAGNKIRIESHFGWSWKLGDARPYMNAMVLLYYSVTDESSYALLSDCKSQFYKDETGDVLMLSIVDQFQACYKNGMDIIGELYIGEKRTEKSSLINEWYKNFYE